MSQKGDGERKAYGHCRACRENIITVQLLDEFGEGVFDCCAYRDELLVGLSKGGRKIFRCWRLIFKLNEG